MRGSLTMLLSEVTVGHAVECRLKLAVPFLLCSLK